MHYQPTYDVSPNRGFSGNQRAFAFGQTCNASMHRPDRLNSIDREARDRSVDRLQCLPATVVAPHHVSRQGLPGSIHGEVTAASDPAPSTKYRLAEMRMAFASSGGLLTVGELADGHDPHSRARFARIAKGIATREIIGFMWQSEPWVPMFQFESRSRLLPRHALQPLFKLLVPLYDAWDMANWFARPNQWLSELRPVDQCTGHLAAVLDVAHLEHFIATGQRSQQDQAAARTNRS